jgi:hypothetical protein
MPRKPLTLYRFRLSGHSHRVELFLSLLGVPVEMAEVELGKGEHKTPEFLARRRTKVIPHAFGERAVLKLMYAALIRAAERWRGLRMTEFEQRQLKAIRDKAARPRRANRAGRERNRHRIPNPFIQQEPDLTVCRCSGAPPSGHTAFIAVEADGLFIDKPMKRFSLEISKNQPIGTDSH